MENVDEGDEAYVAGLKQLLDNLDPVIRQANSTTAIEEILLNLETSDENFHKYDLVKLLRQRIEDEIGPLVDTLVQEKETEIDNQDIASTVSEEILASDAFSNISQAAVSAIKSAANDVIKSISDINTNPSFGFCSSDRPTQFSHRGPNSYGEDSLLTCSFDSDDFMFMSPQKYSILANQLCSDSSIPKKLEALNTLSQIPQTDLINSEFWGVIKQGLLNALKSDHHVLAENSLKFHAKMFTTASGYVTKEIYTCLTNHLIDYFEDPTNHMALIELGLDLGDKRNIKLLKEFRILNQFQHELPLCWVRYPEKHVEEILQSTISLLSILPQSVSASMAHSVVSPLHFLSLIDPQAFWFCKWIHGNYSRAELTKLLSSTKYILKESCKSCIDFALHCKTQSTIEADQETTAMKTNESEALVYSRVEILCSFFIQSISILGRVILYKEGRKIFPLELEDRLESITIPDLLVSFVEVMSYMPPEQDEECIQDEIVPARLAADILKNLASGTAETCKECICKDSVTATLLSPVQKWLDGYIGCFGDVTKSYESSLILIADVLAVIASTENGRSQLLYGERQERWQRTRLAPIHTIAQFTKLSLAGKLDPKPSLQLISAFLFVCRQLYNTCEGLMILNSYCLNEAISSAIGDLKDLKTTSVNTIEIDAKPFNSDFSASDETLSKSISKMSLSSDLNSKVVEAQNDLIFASAMDNEISGSQEQMFLSENTLIDFSHKVSQTSRHVGSKTDIIQYKQSLIDNLLNFVSTPKGVLFVHQTGLIDECIKYMEQRHQQNLQVSKIEKFGYGAMMTQVAATAPGILAIETTGFIKKLLEDTWICLEGVSNDYKQTTLNPYWDDFYDKRCQKLFTTLVNLLSSFVSVYELVCLCSDKKYNLDADDAETNATVTSANAPKVPDNVVELLQELVFVDNTEKMRHLFHFERSHLFGLRVLNCMVTCLDTLLLLQTKYSFQETLLRLQEEEKLESNFYVIDACSVERNQILVRTYLVGGPTERILPARDLLEDADNPYPWPLFSSYPVPISYTPHESSTVITAFEQLDEIGKFLTETESNLFNTLSETHEWLSKCRNIFVSSIRNGSDMVSLKSASLLMERVCLALCQDPEEAILPLIEYSGNEALLQSIQLSEIDQLGTELVMRYGSTLRLIPTVNDVNEQFQNLIKKCKYFLRSQQRSMNSRMHSLKSDYVGFDWFVSSIFLMMNGRTEKTWNFLYQFSSLVASGYVWTARLHASIHLPAEINESGMPCVYFSVCHNLELILQAEIPQIYSAFRVSGYPLSQICQHWLRQCFWNYLDWGEICCYLCCCLLMGIDYQVYFCIAILKHLQEKIFMHAQQKDLIIFLKDEPIRDFKVGNYIDFMIKMQTKYRTVVLPDLQDITKP